MSKTQVLVHLVVVFTVNAAGQSGPDITRYISMIESGQTSEVKSQLPSLLSEHPNNPGVLYLQALVTTDGAEAVRIYQSIVDNFPRSEWADDALHKVYQFYYAIGLYRTAEMKLSQLKKDYPDTPHILREPGMETVDLAEEKEPPPQETRSIEPETKTSAESPAAEPAATFALQVGAYTSNENAEKQKFFFEDLKFPVEVINRVRDARSLYLVMVGTYKTYEEAKAQSAELKKAYNIDSIVVTR
ncbi:MAG: SPOR domain-containing protein [Ignavibacteriae bacterium]|nr:SPOR domain-containing protein [Ignavibacteriota bacterium]